MNPEDLIPETEFKRTKKSAILRYKGESLFIVAWPLAIAPATHLEACEQAIALSRQRHAS